jgi:hypothetical protein
MVVAVAVCLIGRGFAGFLSTTLIIAILSFSLYMWAPPFW